jgi:hypothetical protein
VAVRALQQQEVVLACPPLDRAKGGVYGRQGGEVVLIATLFI